MKYDHRLTITLSPGRGVEQVLTCEAEPGSSCNMWCDEACESVLDGHGGHELRPVDCMVIDWWNWDDSSSMEGYTGPAVEPHSGPIGFTMWGEDGIEWHYAALEPQGSGS